MLFLLNDRVIEIETPEARLLGRWREIGCGDPRQLRAHQAVEFVKARYLDLVKSAPTVCEEQLRDLGALIVSKTGANSLILKPTVSGDVEPRLRDVPPIVLETYQRGAANDQAARAQA